MDELNQTQNSNAPLDLHARSAVPNPISPASQAPQIPQQVPSKKNYLFLIVVLVLVAVGILAWWYLGQMGVEMPVVQEPNINKEAREDISISNDIQNTDSADLDKEFQEVDKDINSL